jgi:hypothetical protein
MRGKQGRSSFLKKRSKKLLNIGSVASCSAQPNNQKHFGSFFQKRTCLLALLLAGCSKPLPVEHFAGTKPEFDPVAFWAGHHTSWGVVENRAGEPTDTVETDCVGTPEASGLHMVQTLKLGDGTVQHRDWHLRREGQAFVATANDMVGEARGEAAGRVFHWRFVLATKPGNALFNVTFDQWMYLLDDGSMMNRTTVRKVGIIIAEVSEVFQIVR